MLDLRKCPLPYFYRVEDVSFLCYNKYIDKIASALSVNPNRFIQYLIGTNNLAAVAFNDTDVESDIFDKLYHDYTDSNAMIIACINTAPYTGFKPHNL